VSAAASPKWTGRVAWTRVRGPRVLSIVAKAALVGGWVLGAVLPGALGPLVAGFAMLLPLPLWALSYFLSLSQAFAPGSLEISPTYLTVHGPTGPRLFARADVVGALVVDRAGAGPSVEIELRNGDRLACLFADAEVARALVAELGFAPGGRRVRSRVAKPTGRLLHPVLASTSFTLAITVAVGLAIAWKPDAQYESGGSTITALVFALTVGIYELLARAVRPPEIVVGDDSVRVEGAFRARSVPLGAPLGVPGDVLVDAERVTALQRLSADRAQVSAASPERRALFGRDGKPIAEWRAALAAALEGASYRGAALTADEARATLRSPEATAEQRVGAAIALRIAGEPERVRVAAAATADDRVRVALEAALEEDEAAVDKALRRLA
jgi:hypothetical protein